MIVQLRSHFDYTQSPEFNAAILGKSAQYVDVATRMTLQKRVDHETEFDNALGDLLSSDRVFDLAPPHAHDDLRKMRDTILAG